MPGPDVGGSSRAGRGRLRFTSSRSRLQRWGHQSANNKRQDTEKQSVFPRGGDVGGNVHRLPIVVHRPVAGRQAGRPPAAARGGNTGAVIAKSACTWTEWDGGTDLGCMRPGSASRLAVAAAAGRCQQREHEPLPPASPKHARSAMPLALLGWCKSGSRGVFALRERREAERLPARDGGDLTRSNSAWKPATHTAQGQPGRVQIAGSCRGFQAQLPARFRVTH